MTEAVDQNAGPLSNRITTAPLPHDPAAVARAFADLEERIAADEQLLPLAGLARQPQVRALLAGVFGCSPYLTSLVLRRPHWLAAALSTAPELRLADLGAVLEAEVAAAQSKPDAMQALRRYKTEAALLIALADLSAVWPIMRVTAAITEVADQALTRAVRFLMRLAATAGDLVPADPARPEAGSGYIVLGMGKHGAAELNYSSDIDLIVFFERGRARLRDGLEPETLFVRLTRDLVRLMQERTPEGYVFRTDLRLRPDPGATQVALSTAAAINYYESVGQNWERAALIKARAVAGDIAAGEAFLRELAPYVWRKYLDFAAISDIHAMKRQIHAFKGFGTIGVAGHNIKLGRGGIREIEFFAQTQQLIAGGRQRDLRTRATLETLDRLSRRDWITAGTAGELGRAYEFLRTIEHRLQMIADEQTQTLPTDPVKLERVVRFSGFATVEQFSTRLRRELETVQRHYGALFENVPELTRAGGNLMFTGDGDDPATVETLRRMGYREPSAVIQTVKDWHFGRYPAMRSARARERLTEFQPVLLEALAATADPSAALQTFDRFLAELPAGVQLFSLLRTNPSLLRLIADIIGTAPRLARILGRRARILDAVLDPGFFGTEPTAEDLTARIRSELQSAGDVQEKLDRSRVVGNEQAFLIGVRVLSGTIAAERAGGAYATLAGTLIAELQHAVETELERQHGRIEGGAAAVLAMGKLGGREMTANSDLDLIVVYDYPAATTQSSGAKPLASQQYYARLTQRLISAITAPTAEGSLYAVDMRLRPSGTSGPVASHLESFIAYQREAAWTWEHMALTRARVLTGPEALCAVIDRTIGEVLTTPREPVPLAADVREMRERIAAQKGSSDLWDLKQVRGGLVDLEFIAQFLQLRHAHARPDVLDPSTLGALTKLAAAGLIEPRAAEVLTGAARLLGSLTQIIRLCFDGRFRPEAAPDGLKSQLARAGEVPDLTRLEADLAEQHQAVHALFEEIVR